MFKPLTLFFLTALLADAKPPLSFVSQNQGSIEIQRGEAPDGLLLARIQSTASHGRPYLHPVRSPDGKGVLTQYSPGHHKHQTGLYWGPTRINGRDYFHNYNKKFWANTKLSNYTELDGDYAPFALRSTCDLLDADGEVILRDEQRWHLIDHETWYTIDMEWIAKAEMDVTIGKHAYGGLFLRMPWQRGVPTECINSEGDKNQAGEGKAAKWVDLAMKIDGMDEMAHIAIIDHPKNAGYPTLWRIDGQFGIGPAFTRKGDVKIPKGGTAHYRYRLVVYQGDFDPKLVAKAQSTFSELP